jgi:hypothetical protein
MDAMTELLQTLTTSPVLLGEVFGYGIAATFAALALYQWLAARQRGREQAADRRKPVNELDRWSGFERRGTK